MQGAVVELIQPGGGRPLKQLGQAPQALGLELQSGGGGEKQLQVLAQVGGGEVGVAVVVGQFLGQFFVEGGGVKGAFAQDRHEGLYLHAGLLHHVQGQAEAVGEAGDQLVKGQLGVQGSSDRSEMARFASEGHEHRPGPFEIGQVATHHHLEAAGQGLRPAPQHGGFQVAGTALLQGDRQVAAFGRRDGRHLQHQPPREGGAGLVEQHLSGDGAVTEHGDHELARSHSLGRAGGELGPRCHQRLGTLLPPVPHVKPEATGQ